MVFTNYAKNIVSIMIGSDLTNKHIQYFAVGAGSETINANTETLTGSEFSRFLITGNPDFTTPKVVTFTGDLNSVQASGLSLMQFGLFASGTKNTGSVYDINQLNGSIVCDGTIELRFESAIQVI
jgi:hypothetical protein